MVLFKLRGEDESVVVNVRGAQTTSEAISIGVYKRVNSTHFLGFPRSNA